MVSTLKEIHTKAQDQPLSSPLATQPLHCPPRCVIFAACIRLGHTHTQLVDYSLKINNSEKKERENSPNRVGRGVNSGGIGGIRKQLEGWKLKRWNCSSSFQTPSHMTLFISHTPMTHSRLQRSFNVQRSSTFIFESRHLQWFFIYRRSPVYILLTTAQRSLPTTRQCRGWTSNFLFLFFISYTNIYLQHNRLLDDKKEYTRAGLHWHGRGSTRLESLIHVSFLLYFQVFLLL